MPCNNSIEQSVFPLGSGATCVLHGRMLVAPCQTFVDTKSVDLHKMDREWQQPDKMDRKWQQPDKMDRKWQQPDKMDRKWQQPEMDHDLMHLLACIGRANSLIKADSEELLPNYLDPLTTIHYDH